MPASSRRARNDRECPAGCGHEKRPTDLLCRRCWYAAPTVLKNEYLSSRAALERDRSRSAIDAVMAAKAKILDSVTPKGNRS